MCTILCSSASIALCLSHTSSMHCVAPSTIQPSTYFLTAHCPSPDSNFFLDIGSWPLCPDTCGCGNTLWIPCSNSLDKLSNCSGSLVCAICIKLLKNTSSMVQNGFPPIELRTYYTRLSPTCSYFQVLVVMILYFPWMDAPAVLQHVCECKITIQHVLFLTPHRISKETMSIPFAKRTVLPTLFVLPDNLVWHRKSSIPLQLHTPFSITDL